MLEVFRFKKDRSLTYLHGEAASSHIENAGSAYQAPSLLACGGSAKDVAFLSTAVNFIFALLLLRLPGFLKFGDSLKQFTIVLTAISALCWIPLIVIPLLVPQVPVVVLIILWIANMIPGLLAEPLRDKWMADLIPAQRMGRYLGLRQIISASLYLATFYLMGFVLDSASLNTNRVYSVVFTIAFAGCLVSLMAYLAVRHSDLTSYSDGTHFGLFDFLQETKQTSMAAFMLYVTLVMFAASISGAFFSVYMLQDLHFSYLTYSMIVSVEFLARIVSLMIWGKIIDKTGAVRLLQIISFLIPVIPVLWLFSSNLLYLGGVQFISGLTWAAFDLCNQSHISSASPENHRLHYIIYQRCIITIASASGPLLGAYLINRVIPIYGSPILSIFLISGIIRLVVVLALVFKIQSIDPVRVDRIPLPSVVHTIYQAPAHKEQNTTAAFLRYQRLSEHFRHLNTACSMQKMTQNTKRLPGSRGEAGLPLSPYRQTLLKNHCSQLANQTGNFRKVSPKSVKSLNEKMVHRIIRQPGVAAR